MIDNVSSGASDPASRGRPANETLPRIAPRPPLTCRPARLRPITHWIGVDMSVSSLAHPSELHLAVAIAPGAADSGSDTRVVAHARPFGPDADRRPGRRQDDGARAAASPRPPHRHTDPGRAAPRAGRAGPDPRAARQSASASERAHLDMAPPPGTPRSPTVDRMVVIGAGPAGLDGRLPAGQGNQAGVHPSSKATRPSASISRTTDIAATGSTSAAIASSRRTRHGRAGCGTR